MKAPIITLKNVKYAEFMSQETSCFKATVYVDGKRFCAVENDGSGGPDHFTPITGPYNAFYAEGGPYKALEARIEATVPSEEKWGRMYQPSFECLVADALDRYLREKDVKAALRTKALYVKDGHLMGVSWKGVRKIGEKHLEAARRDRPGVTFLNEMPFDEAYALYQKHAS